MRTGRLLGLRSQGKVVKGTCMVYGMCTTIYEGHGLWSFGIYRHFSDCFLHTAMVTRVGMGSRVGLNLNILDSSEVLSVSSPMTAASTFPGTRLHPSPLSLIHARSGETWCIAVDSVLLWSPASRR